MAGVPPPEGMTEEDYDAIHAAVVETVRGRWFLEEYARRNRMGEVQEMLAAIGRLETVVTSQKAFAAPADLSPHLRLLAQRADEIAGRLGNLVEDLRESGADEDLCEELAAQVRAIAALPKGGAVEAPARPALAEPRLNLPPASMSQDEAEPIRRYTQPEPASPAPRKEGLAVRPEEEAVAMTEAGDPRLRALASLNSLSLAEKLALFA